MLSLWCQHTVHHRHLHLDVLAELAVKLHALAAASCVNAFQQQTMVINNNCMLSATVYISAFSLY